MDGYCKLVESCLWTCLVLHIIIIGLFVEAGMSWTNELSIWHVPASYDIVVYSDIILFQVK